MIDRRGQKSVFVCVNACAYIIYTERMGHKKKKDLLHTCCIFKLHLIRSSFYMFPVSFAPFFVFSLCVTDRCHQRKNKFQILCFTQRNSCNTQAHFLYFSSPFLTFSLSFRLCIDFSQCAILGFVIFQNTTH